MKRQRRRLTRDEKERVRVAQQERAREKREHEVEEGRDRPDLISAVLVRWPLGPQLLCLSRVLLCLIEQQPQQQQQHCEYYDTLFTEYATVHSLLSDEVLSFAAYYREAYNEAEAFVTRDEENRGHYSDQWRHYYRTVLRVCFVVLLAYDERVRRFVFGHHDLHAALGCRMEAVGSTRGVRFAAACRADVAAYLAEAGERPYELHEACVSRWEEEYMFHHHHHHTVQRPSASKTIDATT